MRDLFIIGFLGLLILLGFRRPFLVTLAYIYVDLVQPQRISYYLLNSIPISLILAILAVLFFLFDKKRGVRFGSIQALMLAFVLWTTITTTTVAVLPDVAWFKWDATWKAVSFGIFLPFVLWTRQRIEAALFFVVFGVASLTIAGGIKTILGGGGYGTLNLMVDNNSGLYEGSTISTVGIALIPVLIYLYRHNRLIGQTKLALLATIGLSICAVLTVIGSEARTGLVCIAVLGGLMFITSKHKLRLVALGTVGLLASIPLLPESWTSRMATIEASESDRSAQTRLAVWKWTLDFVKEHPFGGGFGCYRINEISMTITTRERSGNSEKVTTRVVTDDARAFHNSYFEVLGEHGYPGLAIFLALLFGTLGALRRLSRKLQDDPDMVWARDLAKALTHALLIYMAGSMFVGIATQTVLYIILGLSASLLHVVAWQAQATRPVHRPISLPLRIEAAGAASR